MALQRAGPSRQAAAAARLTGVAALLCACGAAPADDVLAALPAGAELLADLSLEQLSDVVVTTVSRVEERLDRAAASAYVITADAIRRSGATTIADALRLAPTLNVARADANQYAISARGFNNVLANKMLVLIDGRTLYTPLFSGVFWEAQDVLLDDVERIEVVTGPSTALWGSNAVGGLIHIIMRSAAATPGFSAALDAGDRQRGAALRQGFALGATRLRGYAKSSTRDPSRRADGSAVGDAAEGVQVGFRADWSRARQTLLLQGDAHRGRIDQPTGPRTFSGSHLLARWGQAFGGGAGADLQAYVERTERDHPQTFAETLDTADVVGQIALPLAAMHRVLLGAGWRHARDRITQFQAFGFQPAQRAMSWRRLFAQDQVALSPAVTLTLAASLESNPFTSAELLPSVRLAWQASPDQLWWAALARAVRAPSRIDREYFQPAQPPYAIAGGPNFGAEVAEVLEFGQRAQPTAALSYSVTAFYQRHHRLRSLAPTAQGLQFENAIAGHSSGVEAWARWRAADNWQLDAGAFTLHKRLAVRAGASDVGGMAALGNDPRFGASLRSSLDLPRRWSWDASVRHLAALPNPRVPAYTAVDTRLAWAFAPGAELALVGQNLFDPQHAEWGAPANRVELQRAFIVQLRWRP